MTTWDTFMGFTSQQLSTVSLTSIRFKILDQTASFKGIKSVGIINQDCFGIFLPYFKNSHRWGGGILLPFKQTKLNFAQT